MTDKPTPKEMDDLFVEETGFDADDFPAAILDFARAVLAKWGQPAQVAEPVAWLDPWTGTKVTTDYDAYGKHGIPLYTTPQPTQAQADARKPLSHAQAKALVLKYSNDPLNLVFQVELAHGIKEGQHGTE